MKHPLLLAAVAAACLGLTPGEEGPAGGKERPFPDPEKLDSLGPGPSLGDLRLSPSVPVAEWKLEGPLPDRAGSLARTLSTAEERIVEAALASRAGLATATESMHCSAREIARFALEHEALPDAGLLEFMAARCGTATRGIRPAFLAARVPAAAADPEILEKWKPALAELVAKSLEGGPVEIGIHYGRKGDRAVAMVVSGVRGAFVEPFSMIAEGGSVSIRGEVLEPTEAVHALANRGAYAVAPCVAEDSGHAGRFAFRCEIDPGDEVAEIEIATLPVGRLLSSTALRTLARAPGSAGDTWRRVEAASGPAPSDPAEIAQAVHAAVNAVRSRAGLAPLVLSKTQSEAVAALAPHLFASSLGLAPPSVGDLVVLGIAAGWRVGGPVKDVEITTGFTPGTRDIGLWLDTVLRRPSGRSTLLDSRLGILAVGAATAENPPVLAAVAATYELFGREDFASDAERVVERIAKSRPEGAPRPTKLPEPAARAVEAAVRDIREQKLDPAAALERALDETGRSLGRRMQGWILVASQLDALEVPPELRDLDSPELAVGVGFMQPPGSPWGSFVVLVLAAAPGTEI